jgi:hypothetical protein
LFDVINLGEQPIQISAIYLEINSNPKTRLRLRRLEKKGDWLQVPFNLLSKNKAEFWIERWSLYLEIQDAKLGDTDVTEVTTIVIDGMDRKHKGQPIRLTENFRRES